MKRNYAGIFLISAATLLLEISLTRVFSVLFFHHFAFLIISTSLFGFGFSGIFLFFKKSERDLSSRLSVAALLCAISIGLAYKLILILPYGFRDVLGEPILVVRVILYYALLAVPFFFSGYVIGLILSSFAEQAGKYYSFDLAGAAAGCLAVLWLVPLLGASGSVLMASVLAAFSAVVFWPQAKLLRWLAVLCSASALFFSLNADKHFSLPWSKIFFEKHGNFYMAPKRQVEFSAWSPVSRIDILVTPPSRLIYLDGGSNVSFLLPFSGDQEYPKPRRTHRAVPYLISPRGKVCIIGPGGGEDVLTALSHRAESITAVEMDPLIVQIVQGRYRDFIGDIFNHPSVKLLNDEGRSFLRRSQEQFDLIQTVHNCSPMAFASGAFNLTESYLFTVEAFREYWAHLREGGIFAIHRTAILRAASVASLALQQEGITDPENYVIVTSRRGEGETGFYLKRGRINEKELRNLAEIQRGLKLQILYAPLPAFQKDDNAYYNLLVPSLRRKLIREADLILEAPTDNWPFFDHYQRLFSFQKSSTILGEEIKTEYRNWGDLALFSLVGEALLLSSLFILVPLIRYRRLQASFSRWAILAYFGALGVGFILIEISLIQKHILFLGQPVYSISSVLFSLLLSAGIGSLFFQIRFREGRERAWVKLLAFCIPVVVLLELLLVPLLFHQFLGAEKWTRFLLSGLFLMPMGFILGMPFPLGIRILSVKAPEAIPWAWGLNA